MLNFSADLQKLRAQVVTEIRSNQQLENDLNLMDIKIGLLVRNRITLQVQGFSFALEPLKQLNGLWQHFKVHNISYANVQVTCKT